MSKKTRLSELHKDLKASAKKESKTQPREQNTHPIEANAPRGQRSDYLKITITMPSDMLMAMKTIGLKRKAAGQKDCDTSSLVREAVLMWMERQKE